MPYEAELVALAIVLYLYDSSALLYSNEAVLTRGGRGRWAATLGFTGFVFAGRTLCLLNPFTPHHAAFRLRWDFTHAPRAGDATWAESAARYAALRWSILGGALALYVLLPLGLFTPAGAYLEIPAVVLLYGSIVASLIVAARKRLFRGIEGRKFWGLAFECIACPPFGVNLLRRVSLRERVEESAILAAVRSLDAAQWEEFKAQCLARLDGAIQLAADDPVEVGALETQKRRLTQWMVS